jgi:hypothetical protein
MAITERFLQKATKETEIEIFDFENLRYLRCLLLVLNADRFEHAVLRGSLPDKRREFHLAADFQMAWQSRRDV